MLCTIDLSCDSVLCAVMSIIGARSRSPHPCMCNVEIVSVGRSDAGRQAVCPSAGWPAGQSARAWLVSVLPFPLPSCSSADLTHAVALLACVPPSLPPSYPSVGLASSPSSQTRSRLHLAGYGTSKNSGGSGGWRRRWSRDKPGYNTSKNSGGAGGRRRQLS